MNAWIIAGAIAAILLLLWAAFFGPKTVPDLWASFRRRRAQPPPPPVPPGAPAHIPPGPDPFFVNREADVDALVRAFLVRRPLPLLALHGSPGIGKTAIAKQAVNNPRVQAAFPGRVLWFDSTPETYVGLLDTLARALGAADIAADVPAEDLKADALRGLLASEPLLLAVFNSADGPAAQALDRLAAAGFPLALLATSRDLLLRLSRHEVLPLDPGAAERVFIRYAYPRGIIEGHPDDRRLPQGDASAVRQALPLLGGNPLAISIAAGALGQRTAADLLRDLRADPLRVLGPVERAFEVSWGFLAPEERRLFAALGLFAGDTFSSDAVLAMAGPEMGEPLGRLVRASLVGFDQRAGRYSLHPLTREYARGKQAKVSLDGDACRLRLAAFFHGLVLQRRSGSYDDLSALDREWGHLRSPADGDGLLGWLAARPAQDAPAARLLVETLDGLSQYMDIRGYWAERLALAEAALPRAETLGEDRLLASFLHNAAILFQNRGRPEEARELYARSLQTFERLGDQQGIAITLHQMGILAQGQGRLEEARELYARSLQTFERLGDQRGIASALHQMGILAQGRGQLEEARDLYARSLQIKERLGDQRGIASTLHQMGMLAQDQGRLEEARELYARSLQIKERLGDQQGIAITLHQMGMLAQGQGRLEEARDLYARSLQIKERLGDQRGIAITLHQMGILAQGQGRPEEARDLYVRSLQIAERLGDQGGIAATLHQMGMLAEDTGDSAAAQQHFTKAFEILRALGSPDAAIAERSLARVRAARPPPTP